VYDPGNFRYRWGLGMSPSTGVPWHWSDPITLPWSGETKMGGGVALADIDRDAEGHLDAVMVGVQRMAGSSIFYYKVAFNPDDLAVASSWSKVYWGPTIGGNQEGGDAAMADIDGNVIPDLLLMSVDAPDNENSFWYNIGWNMGIDGKVNSWSEKIQVNGLGLFNSGGGAALGDIDKDGRPDLVLMAVDNPEGTNKFWYKVGRNLDKTGKAASWTSTIIAPVYLGDLSAGAGAALADVNNNGKLDLVLSNIDNPAGANDFWCYIGWDIDINGNVTGWSSRFIGPALGDITNGGGVAVGRITKNGSLDLLLMAIDNPYGAD
jgi:hypothetical protein